MRLCAAVTLAILPAALAQTPSPGNPTLTSRSTLVRVPALVRDHSDKLVYSLREKDFVLTDDGVPQKLHLEDDTGGEPLALVIDIETGGAGARQLAKYTGLAAMAGSIAGGVPHEVAVVGFDGSPVLVKDFTSDTDAAGHAMQEIVGQQSGDSGAAILDSLDFSIKLLRNRPPQYRPILLVSETLDAGSHLKLEEALRAFDDSDTTIYALAFKHQELREARGAKDFRPWVSPLVVNAEAGSSRASPRLHEPRSQRSTSRSQ